MRQTVTKSAAVGAIAMACLLAAALACVAATPGNAYAQDKTTVYVLTKHSTKWSESSTALSYKYDKNGLLAKEVQYYKFDGETYKTTMKYAYDKKNRLTSRAAYFSGGGTYKTTFKLDKKGHVVKGTSKSSKSKSVETYSYNSKGQLVKYKAVGATLKYKYDAKGNVTRVSDSDTTYYYKLDKKGNPVEHAYKAQQSGASKVVDFTYKNTYKNGNLVKVVATDQQQPGEYSTSHTDTYTYKKVKVPKSVAKMVKAQQKALLNEWLPVMSAHK